MIEITYSYSQKVGDRWNTYDRNQIGRDGSTPVGYGPNGPGSQFSLEELPGVIRVLTEQLGTVPTLTLHPVPL